MSSFRHDYPELNAAQRRMLLMKLRDFIGEDEGRELPLGLVTDSTGYRKELTRWTERPHEFARNQLREELRAVLTEYFEGPAQ
jgi:hypothetical protein